MKKYVPKYRAGLIIVCSVDKTSLRAARVRTVTSRSRKLGLICSNRRDVDGSNYSLPLIVLGLRAAAARVEQAELACRHCAAANWTVSKRLAKSRDRPLMCARAARE